MAAVPSAKAASLCIPQDCICCIPGAAGAFVGAEDQFVVILANDGLSASVFDTAKIGFAPPAASLLLDLSSSGAVNIFPGPRPLPQTG